MGIYKKMKREKALLLSSISSSISFGFGNRSNAFLEKIKFPSKVTSNTPPPEEISVTSHSGNFFLRSASKLEARGK